MEPIHYHGNTFIHYELDDVNEVNFIEKGEYCLGYEINKKVHLKLKFSGHSCFGAFECSYNKRSVIIYKTFNTCEGYIIRKSKWKALESCNEELFSIMRRRTLFHYFYKIRNPLLVEK